MRFGKKMLTKLFGYMISQKGSRRQHSQCHKHKKLSSPNTCLLHLTRVMSLMLQPSAMNRQIRILSQAQKHRQRWNNYYVLDRNGRIISFYTRTYAYATTTQVNVLQVRTPRLHGTRSVCVSAETSRLSASTITTPQDRHARAAYAA